MLNGPAQIQTVVMTPSTAGVRVETRERLLTAAFVRLTLADVAYFTSTGVAIYTLPLWVTGPVGSDKSGAGLAFGAFAISALILRPFAGRLSDTKGRRPLLVGGALLSAFGMFATGTPTASRSSYCCGCCSEWLKQPSLSPRLRR
jgi:MFS family permease